MTFIRDGCHGRITQGYHGRITQYSGTQVIRTPKGHAKVSVLPGCPYSERAPRKIRQVHMFYHHEE